MTEAVDITSETYLGIILDRATKMPVIMISASGGIDIEEVAAKTPEKIHKFTVNPRVGLRPFEARNLAYNVFRDIKLVRQVADIIMKLYDVFWKVDASLVEINPLITTPINQVIAIDAKLNIDDNGLFRQKDVSACAISMPKIRPRSKPASRA